MILYKVGDWVRMRVPPIAVDDETVAVAHILESTTQLCEAGIEQTVYTVRIWNKRFTEWVFTKDQFHIREMGIACICEAPEQLPDTDTNT